MMDNPSAPPEVVTVDDPAALARASAERFISIAKDAVRDRNRFDVALSGGSTPKALLELLATDEFRDQLPWDCVQVFWSDERFVEPESSDSNFKMAYQALLSRVPIPERCVHQVPTVGVTPDESAALYEEGVKRIVVASATDIPSFDLILLGLGPDGHTASLFPDTAALSVQDRLVVANFVPKFSAWRITFTFPLLNAARNVLFLAQGEDKAQRVAEVLGQHAQLPAGGVRPTHGHVAWFLDAASASRLGNQG